MLSDTIDEIIYLRSISDRQSKSLDLGTFKRRVQSYEVCRDCRLPGEHTDFDVLVWLVDHPFVDLVGDGNDVVFLAQVGNRCQLLQREHLVATKRNTDTTEYIANKPFKQPTIPQS